MRKHIQQQCVGLLSTVREVHYALSVSDEQKEEYTALCGEAIDVVEQRILEGIKENQDLMERVNTYKEVLGRVTQTEDYYMEDIIVMDKFIEHLIHELIAIKSVYQVVFFPYSASMWDSLESVYLACREDERCECIVVPIPYYKFDATRKEWHYAYEGDKFPKNIPVVHYEAYDIKVNMPDVAYIHNPYDQYNRVTQVDERYFSYNLKQYVQQLVYIPYYVEKVEDAGAKHHCNAYNHVDYIVVQSEYHKKQFSHMSCYSKMLPLGSPKVDRIINKDTQKKNIPNEWKTIIANKKTIMLNLTISTILVHGICALNKIQKLFEQVKKQDVVLVWRPHPLLQATIDSMRPELTVHYQELLDYFATNRVGIFDDTPDITETVALCDAYIGCDSSSVVNLFRAVRKPIYYINYGQFYDEKNEDNIHITQMENVNGKIMVLTDQCNAIFKFDKNYNVLSYQSIAYEKMHRKSMYSLGVVKENKLYLAPVRGSKALVYDSDKDSIREMIELGDNLKGYGRTAVYKDKIVYMPLFKENEGQSIVVYDTLNRKTVYYAECIKKWKESASENIQSNSVCNYYQRDNKLYLCAQDTGSILEFDIVTGKHRIIAIGNIGYSAITGEGTIIWLGEILSGNIIEFNLKNNKKKQYDKPLNIRGKEGAIATLGMYRALFKVGSKIVAFPFGASATMIVDLMTETSQLWMEEFFENGFNKDDNSNVCNFVKQIDLTTILVQRNKDKVLAKINLEAMTYETFEIKVNAALLEDFREAYHRDMCQQYYIEESMYYSVDEFIEQIKEETIQVYDNEASIHRFNSNMQGTAGRAIHEYMIDKLDRGL